MDIDKADRVRSYVQAQLAFVPFYGTNILGPGGSQSEAFGLQTPVLTARNPLVGSQPEFNPSSAPVPVQVQGSKGASAETDPIPIEEITKNRPAKRPPTAKEQNQQSPTLRKGGLLISDPDTSSEPTKDVSPKRKRRRRREKPRLPTGLSFLYSFAPKNVGPSRLTVSRLKARLNLDIYDPQIPAGDKGFFGKGKSSLTVPGISLLDQTCRFSPVRCRRSQSFISLLKAQPIFHERPDSSCLGKEQRTPNPTRNTTEVATSLQEQTKAIPDNDPTNWDIELENGILPSDSSSLACENTVVINTARNWNSLEETQQPSRPTTDSRGAPQSVVTCSSDEHSPSPLHVASRFFPTHVPSLSLCEDISASRTSVVELEYADGEPDVPALDHFADCDCLDVGWGCNPSLETDSFLDSDYGAYPSGTLHAILIMAGLTMVDKSIKIEGARGTMHSTLKPHSLSQYTPRVIARSGV